MPGPAVADPEQTVRKQDADVVLRIDSSYGKAWRKGEPVQVELFYDSSQRDANTSVERVSQLVEGYARQQGAMRLVARGMSPGVAWPLQVAKRDQATPQSRAVLMFAMLPYFFVITIFMGGMYLAIDLTAGERERQSLEPLFANPVARWKILCGKLAAICAFSTASLLITLLAFAVVGQFVPTEKLGMELDLGLHFATYVLLLMSAAGAAAVGVAVDGGGVRQELSRGADLYLAADADPDHSQCAAVVHADQGAGVDVCHTRCSVRTSASCSCCAATASARSRSGCAWPAVWRRHCWRCW